MKQTIDKNSKTGIQYHTLTIDLYSVCQHRQVHTLSGLLRSQEPLPNSNPNTWMPCREAVCTIFMMVFDHYDPARVQTATYPSKLCQRRFYVYYTYNNIGIIILYSLVYSQLYVNVHVICIHIIEIYVYMYRFKFYLY